LNFTNPPRAKSSPALKAEGGPFETFADIKHSEKKTSQGFLISLCIALQEEQEASGSWRKRKLRNRDHQWHNQGW